MEEETFYEGTPLVLPGNRCAFPLCECFASLGGRCYNKGASGAARLPANGIPQEKDTLSTKQTKTKISFILASLSIVLALSAIYVLSVRRKAAKTTYGVAKRYLSAVIAADEGAIRDLIRQDARCSPPFEHISAALNEHIAMLAGSKVRAVQITVEPREGVSVLPGSESAEISFEHRETGGEGAWHTSTLWLITSPPYADGRRYICHLGGE